MIPPSDHQPFSLFCNDFLKGRIWSVCLQSLPFNPTLVLHGSVTAATLLQIFFLVSFLLSLGMERTDITLWPRTCCPRVHTRRSHKLWVLCQDRHLPWCISECLPGHAPMHSPSQGACGAFAMSRTWQPSWKLSRRLNWGQVSVQSNRSHETSLWEK